MRLLHFKIIPYRTTNKHMRLNHRLRESDNEHFFSYLTCYSTYLQYYTVTSVNGLSNYLNFLLRQIKHGIVTKSWLFHIFKYNFTNVIYFLMKSSEDTIVANNVMSPQISHLLTSYWNASIVYSYFWWEEITLHWLVYPLCCCHVRR